MTAAELLPHWLPAIADQVPGLPFFHAHTHTGSGDPDGLPLAAEFPGARVILAQAAISDLGGIWARLPDAPNVLVDTSGWNPADLAALFALVPPGQILFASDAPYGPPSVVALMALRFALQAGAPPPPGGPGPGPPNPRPLVRGAPARPRPAPGAGRAGPPPAGV